jgi:hypothetical protein
MVPEPSGHDCGNAGNESEYESYENEIYENDGGVSPTAFSSETQNDFVSGDVAGKFIINHSLKEAYTLITHLCTIPSFFRFPMVNISRVSSAPTAAPSISVSAVSVAVSITISILVAIPAFSVTVSFSVPLKISVSLTVPLVVDVILVLHITVHLKEFLS